MASKRIHLSPLHCGIDLSLLQKEWEKCHGISDAINKQQKWKKEYEAQVREISRKMSIAKTERDDLEENSKITNNAGKRKRAILKKEC